MIRRACIAGALAATVSLLLAASASATHLDPKNATYWTLPALPHHSTNYREGALTTSPDGNAVYVADTNRNRVEEYASDGAPLHVYGPTKFRRPSGITTDLAGNVYVVYQTEGVVVKLTADLKYLTSWSVFGARAIAADRSGRLWVLTDFLNAVGEYNATGQSIGGFVANLPGAFFPQAGADPTYFPQSGYGAPYRTVATAITVDSAGDPIVAGQSYQALSDTEPDCHYVIDNLKLDHHPYPDPLISGEAVRFTPGGSPKAYGWLSDSNLGCAIGWHSGGTGAEGVAVDPNAGDVYAPPSDEIGVAHLFGDLQNSKQNLKVGVGPCHAANCVLIDGHAVFVNDIVGIAFDCRSNLYLLSDTYPSRYVTKFANSDYVAPGRCNPLLQRLSSMPVVTVSPAFRMDGPGKASVPLGCHLRVCVGSVRLTSASALCRGCALSLQRRFRIRTGSQRTLTLTLTRTGRALLARHPGLAIRVAGKLRRGRTFRQAERLRLPVKLSASCTMPSSIGGSAVVSGTLEPAHRGQTIHIAYLPPLSSSGFAMAIERSAVTNRSGRFSARYPLAQAGNWIVSVTWGGNRAEQPASARPCGGGVPQAGTQLALACPSEVAAGTPARFSGTLSGAPADVLMAVLYETPSGAIIAHDVMTGPDGSFADSFTPDQAGNWQAIGHYNGDEDRSSSQAICQFTVAPTPSAISLSCTPAPNRRAISCSGRLTWGGAGLDGRQVTLTYQPPGASPSTIHTARTAPDGTYGDTYNAPAGAQLAPGAWQVRADYGGDNAHGPASTTETRNVS